MNKTTQKSYSLTVLVPVYNAGPRTAANIRKNQELLARLTDADLRITIIDDNSLKHDPDFAAWILDVQKGAVPGIAYQRFEQGPSRRENLGHALADVRAEITGFFDADLILETRFIEKIPRLWSPPAADILIASRSVPGARVKRKVWRACLSWLYNRMIRALFGSSIRDHQCGIKFFRSDALRPILNDMGYDREIMRGWFWDASLLILAQRRGLEILELPVDWEDGEESTFNFWRELRCLISIIELKRKLR